MEEQQRTTENGTTENGTTGKPEEFQQPEGTAVPGGQPAQAAPQSGTQEQVQADMARGKKKNVLIWIIAAVVAVAAAIVIGVLVYINSPSYKAGRALAAAERYLDEMDYEQAVLQFQLALELDPDNEELAAAINGHLQEFLQMAESYGEAGDYNMERRMASYVLLFQEENEQAEALIARAGVQELLEQARKEFDAGNYEGAKEKYTEALNGGAGEDEVNPYLPLCDAYRKLLALCEAGDWTGVAGYIDSGEFDVIAGWMGTMNPQFAAGNVQIVMGEKDGSYYVITGDLNKENGAGYGTGVVSSANTYAIYSGSWADYVPEGEGTLRVWYKNEDMYAGNYYTGSFAGGVLDGSATLNTPVNGNATDLGIAVSAGRVSVFKTDEEGNVWLLDSTDAGAYVVEGVTEEAGTVGGYSAGVPGFGGSDARLSVTYMLFDSEPPVLSCSLTVGRWYELSWTSTNVPIGRGITAVDNVDGDITDRITNTSNRVKNSWGEKADWAFGLVVEYSATDAAGNTGTLTVTYEYENMCGEAGFKVVSVK